MQVHFKRYSSHHPHTLSPSFLRSLVLFPILSLLLSPFLLFAITSSSLYFFTLSHYLSCSGVLSFSLFSLSFSFIPFLVLLSFLDSLSYSFSFHSYSLNVLSLLPLTLSYVLSLSLSLSLIHSLIGYIATLLNQYTFQLYEALKRLE